MSLFDPTTQTTTGRPTRGQVPIFRIMLNGTAMDVTVSEAALFFGEGLHSTATLSVSSSTLLNTDGVLNSAISFFFGMAPQTEVFNGYVTAVKEDPQSNTGSLNFQMQITGPTKLMQEGRPGFRVNSTISFAIESLVSQAGLGYIGHPTTFIWPTLAQTTETNWKMINNWAARLGWCIYDRYGVVMCYDPLVLFQNNGSYIKLISTTYVMSDTDTERALMDFAPEEVADISIENTGQQIAYFNGNVVQVAQQQGNFTSYAFLPDFVIRTAGEAAIYVNSRKSTTEDWSQQAMARVLGNASLYPGLNVDILMVAPNTMRNQYNGRWLIRSVQHHMDRQQFQTQLSVCRPDSKTPTYTGAYVNFWQQVNRPKPTMTLFDNKWTSSWADRRVQTVAS